MKSSYMYTLSVSAVMTYFVILFRKRRIRNVKVMKESVFITGCDSGIGLCFAKHLASMGCVVFAGVLDTNSCGATELSKFRANGTIKILKVDVTCNETINKSVQEVSDIIDRENLELTTVINNAGVMVFGEFEWQTEEQLTRQININLLGYMKIAKAFLPLLQRFSGRLVNVSSHCALVPLPCLSVYSATKSAVEAWSSSLGIEMHKFKVPVITLIPGSYVRESGILKGHKKNTEEMWNEMNSDRKAKCTEYFEPVMNYMAAVPDPQPINDPALLSVLRSAVFSSNPRHTYINSPWRYSLYHSLISAAGPFQSLRRLLILAYVSLPKYK